MTGRRLCALSAGRFAIVLLFASSVATGDDESQRLLDMGDKSWARRAEHALGHTAATGPIVEAVAAYSRAIELAPQRLDLRVRLLRALFFQGQYATPDEATKKRLFDRGRLLFETSADLLAQRIGVSRDEDPHKAALALGREPEAGPLHYWGAVHWGLWGEHFGNLAAVKKGVAKKVRDYGEVARLLSPEYDGGAPYRLLGRMHAVAPRVPLFTLWIDRELSIHYLERAHAIDAENPLHGAFLGEALLDHGPAAARTRGMALLDGAAKAEPRPSYQVEDARAIDDASKALAEREREQR
ncbi:MAG TPA: hypothetical protein VNB06_08515 [Thermoanaerobaculia bacterium]|nr:hypothetical protein [Thermoanaerobaculia bacterium]